MMDVLRTVAVVGASRHRGKFGNKSVRAHQAAGFTVFPINPQAVPIEGLTSYATLRELPVRPIDRITMYVPPHIGLSLLDDIAACQPREVWFNPGSDSAELLAAARQRGLPVICGCSIVDVGFSPANFPDE